MANSSEDEKLLEQFKEDIDSFLTITEEPRFLSERNRDYRDNKQWTATEKAEVEKRWQACVTVNRIKPKVEGLKGLLIQRKTDPKAYARTQKHEKAAEAITDALRYVADNTKFDRLKLGVADNFFVEGYGAAMTEVTQKGDQIEISCTRIPWDRYYFDYHSRELDFSDKRWDGVVVWMDAEVVKETFDLTDEEIEELYDDNDGGAFANGFDTFDDSPRWVDKKEQRIRVCQHFYIHKGEWYLCYFAAGKMLMKPEPSPYLDEFGEPMNPIEGATAHIDRDGNRYGEVSFWIDLQDEINHRRSKFLFLLSQRQTMGRRGAIQDIAALKRELAKPDGHVEYDGEANDFSMIPTNDMAQGQFTLLQEAKGELDAVGFNAQLSGQRQGDLSNQAILSLQQAGTNELSSLYEALLDWENRVYRQFWCRIKQFWKEEKWLRVLDDKTKLRWVGLNQQITLKMMLEERSKDEALPLGARQAANDQLMQLMQAQAPELNNPVEVRNPVPEVDVDITIETSYDLVNIQRDQFEMMFKLAQTRPEIPFTEMLKLSELRNKDAIIANIEAQQNASAQAAQQQQQQETQIEASEVQSKNDLNSAKAERERQQARKHSVEADQSLVQTELMLEQGVEDPAVVI